MKSDPFRLLVLFALLFSAIDASTWRFNVPRIEGPSSFKMDEKCEPPTGGPTFGPPLHLACAQEHSATVQPKVVIEIQSETQSVKMITAAPNENVILKFLMVFKKAPSVAPGAWEKSPKQVERMKSSGKLIGTYVSFEKCVVIFSLSRSFTLFFFLFFLVLSPPFLCVIYVCEQYTPDST